MHITNAYGTFISLDNIINGNSSLKKFLYTGKDSIKNFMTRDIELWVDYTSKDDEPKSIKIDGATILKQYPCKEYNYNIGRYSKGFKKKYLLNGTDNMITVNGKKLYRVTICDGIIFLDEDIYKADFKCDRRYNIETIFTLINPLKK